MFTRHLTRRWSGGLPVLCSRVLGKCREDHVPMLSGWSEQRAAARTLLSFDKLVSALCVHRMAAAHTRNTYATHTSQTRIANPPNDVFICLSSGSASTSYGRHCASSLLHRSASSCLPAMSRWCVQRAIGAYVSPVYVTASFAAPSCVSRRFQSSTSAGDSDYYAILGVRPDASLEEIKSAYKKLALQYHPDKNHDPGAEEKFKNISSAYQVVGNKEQRRDYDAQRAMYSRMGGGRGAGGGGAGYDQSPHASSWGSSSGGSGSAFSASYNTGNTYTHRQSMSKEEADRLFRDIFGGMNIDQIFRNFEQEIGRSSGNVRGITGVGGGFPGSVPFDQVNNPFRTFTAGPQTASSQRIFVDSHGNRLEETTYVDSRGKKFTVRRTSSSDPHASVNQTDEDHYRSLNRSSDGGYRFGQSRVKPAQAVFDSYRSAYSGGQEGGGGFSSASQPANPLVGLMYIVAWSVVLLTLIYCFLHFLVDHPIFTMAVILITALGGKGMRR